MLRTVTTKTLFDSRRSLAGWSVSLVLLVAMYAAIWPSIRDQPSMKDFLDQMPEAFRALFTTSGADLSTPVGYVQVELLSFMGPMLLLIYTVTAGASAIAGEEDRHTLDLVLANPIGRGRLVLEKFAAMLAGTTLLTVVLAVALIVEGVPTGMRLPAGHVAAAMAHLALLALVFGALALAIGAATGHPGASRALPAVLAVAGYVLNGLGSVVDWLRPLRKLSPFYQFTGHDPLRSGVSLPAVGVSVATVAVLVAVAVVAFRRRDIAA